MKKNSKIYVVFVLLTLCIPKSWAQNISAFSQKSNYKISGYINLGSNYYNNTGTTISSYSPFGYSANGGIHIQLGAINVPINFTISDVSKNISSPFNFYGASPYYKWAKLHLGYRSINFSRYTYSGKTFLGAGMELTPGKFQLTAFRGILQNRLQLLDTLLANTVLPTYQRYITGSKIGWGNRHNKIHLMAVQVKDKYDPNIETPYQPQENFVLGTMISYRFFKRIYFKSNVNASIFTNDQNALAVDLPSSVEKEITPLHGINSTSRLALAGDAAIEYRHKGYQFGINYRRIDPFYNSLATNYLQNDIQNLTATFAIPMLRRKLRIRGSLGQQKDNLFNQKSFTSNRLIGSMAASYIPGQNFNVMLRYANYQHESQSGIAAIRDTLRILTTTQNLSLSSLVRLHNTETANTTLFFNAYTNNVIDEVATDTRDAAFSGIGANVRLSYNSKSIGLIIGPLINYTRYENSMFSQGKIGGGINISKSFFDKKLSTTLTAMIFQNQFDDKDNGRIFNGNINFQYNMTRNTNLRFRLAANDFQPILNTPYTEMRGSLSFGYTFNKN